MNLVMALGMKSLGTVRAALQTGDAVTKTPARNTGDSELAHRAETALLIPEKAKDTRSPERDLHMIRLAFLEVGFIGRIVGVRVASNLDMSLDGSTTGQQ
jgi:hypothetical protein